LPFAGGFGVLCDAHLTSSSRVTDVGIAELKQMASPECEIRRFDQTAVLICTEMAALGVCLVVFILAIKVCCEERAAFDKPAPDAKKGESTSGKEDVQDK
jgi:hypothetical protein